MSSGSLQFAPQAPFLAHHAPGCRRTVTCAGGSSIAGHPPRAETGALPSKTVQPDCQGTMLGRRVARGPRAEGVSRRSAISPLTRAKRRNQCDRMTSRKRFNPFWVCFAVSLGRSPDPCTKSSTAFYGRSSRRDSQISTSRFVQQNAFRRLPWPGSSSSSHTADFPGQVRQCLVGKSLVSQDPVSRCTTLCHPQPRRTGFSA
jgi:hypothetical protein